MASRHLQHIEDMLKGYNELKNIIEQDKLVLMEEITVKAVTIKNVVVQPSNEFNSVTENEFLNIFAIEERLKKNEAKKRRIDAALRMLTKVQYNIVYYYYFQEHKWPIVAHYMHMSERDCQRKRDKALTTISKYLYGKEIDKRTGNCQLVLDEMKV